MRFFFPSGLVGVVGAVLSSSVADATADHYIRISSSPSSNSSLTGRLAYLPQPRPNASSPYPGTPLTFPLSHSNASTFHISTDVYGNSFLNTSRSNRQAYWDPNDEISVQSTNSTAWPVNFLPELYGSTQIVPSLSSAPNGIQNLSLDIRQYGGYGELEEDAHLPQLCPTTHAGEAPILFLATQAMGKGCVHVGLEWIVA